MMRVPGAFMLLFACATSACDRPTDLASEANAIGQETVPAAPPKTPPPEISAGEPSEEAAATAAEGSKPDDFNPSSGYAPKNSADTVLDYRPELAGEIAGLPPLSDLTALAQSFRAWKMKAAGSPGHYGQGAVQLGADPQEYRPSNAELMAAEAGDRLSAAIAGAGSEARAALAAQLVDEPEARVYRRFEYRHADVIGSGRFFYASEPKEARLPL